MTFVVVKVLVDKCSLGGVMRCRNWLEPLHVPAVLVFEIQWIHIAGSWGRQLARNTPLIALYELGHGHLQILLEGCSGADEGCK
jgi:hypothetical protein